MSDRSRTYLSALSALIERHKYAWLAGVFVAVTLARAVFSGVLWNTDSYSYQEAWHDFISHGQIDCFRTPLYPVIIGAAKAAFGAAWQWAIVVMQSAVYLASLACLISLCRRLADKWWVWWSAALIYIVFPPVSFYNFTIGTESLSASLTVFMIALVARFLQRPQALTAVGIGLLQVVMVALRPSLLVVVPTFGVFLIASLIVHRWRRRAVALMASCLIPIAACVPYVMEMHRITGLYALSTVNVTNNYYMCRIDDVIYYEYLADRPDVVAKMKEFDKTGYDEYGPRSIRQWKEWGAIERIWDYRDIDAYTSAIYRDHPTLRYKWFVRRVGESLTQPEYWKDWIYYTVVVLYAVALVAIIRSRRKHEASAVPGVSAANLLLLTYAAGTIFMVLWMCQADYSRLMYPAVPTLLLMGAQLLGCIDSRRPYLHLTHLNSHATRP